MGSAYALTRALESGATRWLALVGALLGLGFLAKMMQAFLVVPGFAAVYLLAAPTPLRRRIGQLLAGGVALVAAAGWWVAIVALWPASSRPYIGGSQDNSILNLIFGYNGFGRLTGNEVGSVVGGRSLGAGGGAAGMWGPTGITRLFGAEMGTQISWLLPGALLTVVVLLWRTRRAPRGDGARAAVLIWGSWLVVSGLVLSFAQGIIHPYYTVALAPAIGALVGIGGVGFWRRRHALAARLALALGLATTAVWADILLGRTPTWLPWLRVCIVAGGLASAAVLAAGPSVWSRVRLPGGVVAAGALVLSLAAPAAYAVQTAASTHGGSLPAAGPSGAVSQGGPGGGGARRGGFLGRPGGFAGAPGGFAGAPIGAGRRPGGLGLPAGGAPGRGGFGGGALGGLLERWHAEQRARHAPAR